MLFHITILRAERPNYHGMDDDGHDDDFCGMVDQ